MTMTPDPLLQCRGLRKCFITRGREVCVLGSVDLAVRAGEVVVIRGRSGAGKSTLLGLLGGLERPTSGSVLLGSERLEALSASALASLRRRRIGIIFQSHNLLPSWTARENVEAALMHAGVPAGARRARAAGLLKALGLEDRLGYLPAELSVGQQQRVAIARALVNEPSVILADEPTGDVDPETAAEIVSLLTAPVHERGVALVVATHGAFPLDGADRVCHLEGGRLIGGDGLDR
ncbi:MAG: ATP-binding cassette domain-containing protein [Armatimonadetes bacterium]|nr:ATP-binding cassette domain-containing protein [Armatimonadota bacterium]